MKKKKTLFADILGSLTKYFIILVVAVVICIALSGLKIVDSGNVAVILRFGEIVGDSYEEQVHKPGLLLAFPYIIDEVVMIPTDSVIEQLVTTHYTDGNIMSGSSGGYVITGDQNIAVISASVKYVISDPVAYALHVADGSSIINASVSNAMITEAATLGVDSLLTDGKDDFNASVLNSAAAKLKAADIGVTISTLELTQVSMPAEVKSIYEQVNSSTVQAATMLQEAAQYRTKVIAFVIAFVIALIRNGILKSKLKSVRRQTEASVYVRAGSMNVTEARDFFLYRTVSKTAKESSKSSGGSSTHRSSSGASHGGRGGKF